MKPRYLNGQKAICGYLGCSRSTLKRWIQEQGLPVYRPAHTKRGRVVASVQALDRWMKNQRISETTNGNPSAADHAPERGPDTGPDGITPTR